MTFRYDTLPNACPRGLWRQGHQLYLGLSTSQKPVRESQGRERPTASLPGVGLREVVRVRVDEVDGEQPGPCGACRTLQDSILVTALQRRSPAHTNHPQSYPRVLEVPRQLPGHLPGHLKRNPDIWKVTGRGAKAGETANGPRPWASPSADI